MGAKINAKDDSLSRLPTEDENLGSKMAATMFKVPLMDGLPITAVDIADQYLR